MGRYFKFEANTFDFATNASVSFKKDYFMDFVFGGDRSQRVYGLTKVHPEMTVEYDLNGAKFLQYALGSISANTATIGVGDLTELSSLDVTVDGIAAGIQNAKVNTWELTVQEGNPVTAQFTALGINTIGTTVAAYTPDWANGPVLPSNVKCTIAGQGVDFTKLSLKIDNKIDAIYKTSTIPVTLRPAGLEITGALSLPEFTNTNVIDGAMTIVLTSIATISLAVVKFMEIPPKVKGYDLPTTDYTFTAFPANTGPSILVNLGNTTKW